MSVIVVINGRLTKDVETKTSGDNKFYSASIAVDVMSYNKDTKKNEKATVFFSLTMASHYEKILSFFKKGSPIHIIGNMGLPRVHEGKAYLDLKVIHLDFVPGGNDGSAKSTKKNEETAQVADEDDLPF